MSTEPAAALQHVAETCCCPLSLSRELSLLNALMRRSACGRYRDSTGARRATSLDHHSRVGATQRPEIAASHVNDAHHSQKSLVSVCVCHARIHFVRCHRMNANPTFPTTRTPLLLPGCVIIYRAVPESTRTFFLLLAPSGGAEEGPFQIDRVSSNENLSLSTLKPPRKLRQFIDILRAAVEQKPTNGLRARVNFFDAIFCGARHARSSSWHGQWALRNGSLVDRVSVFVTPARPPSSGRHAV